MSYFGHPRGFNNYLPSVDYFVQVLLSHLGDLLVCLLVFFLIHVINALFSYRLNALGIYPRRAFGLPGILFCPFLHGNTTHLIVNMLMLATLSVMILAHGYLFYLHLSLWIVLVSGFAIWLFARPGLHIGASALVMGYFGFLLAYGLLHPSLLSVFLLLVCLYYFSGLFTSLLPAGRAVSWEGHVFGFIAGALAVAYVALLN
jgi:membrane associated rhomboid family serine protease